MQSSTPPKISAVPYRKSVARYVLPVAIVIMGLAAVCVAAKEFSMPPAKAATTYPAHDQHSDESVTVAIDPYDTPEKQNIFSAHYGEVGLLPVFVVVTNDGNEPVVMTGMKAELVTMDRSKLEPATVDDIYRRLSHPSPRNNYPLPFPTKKIKGGVSKQTLEEIQRARFGARAVEPHSSQAGFLFFDISDLSGTISGARFYLTGVKDSNGDELMYFEVPLERANSSAKPD
ncbi:MAG: hypothetical protein NVS1B11_28850 [Terriglobales bacterium]